jgi:hypothetical protein
VKDKNNVRYIGFRSANGGRCFEFSISATERGDFRTSFEIPALFFSGSNRIRLQEGVAICYAKLKYLLELGPVSNVPRELCLTADDVAQYRDRPPRSSKQQAGSRENADITNDVTADGRK